MYIYVLHSFSTFSNLKCNSAREESGGRMTRGYAVAIFLNFTTIAGKSSPKLQQQINFLQPPPSSLQHLELKLGSKLLVKH